MTPSLFSRGRLVAAYDAVAEDYAATFAEELSGKPFDRELLDSFAARLAGRGSVGDLGCGPGHVTRYLADRGVDMIGIDLSSAMVAVARRLNPELSFCQGDLAALEVTDGAWCGLVAFYSLIHISRRALGSAVAELRRVLCPGGLVLLAVHEGQGQIHTRNWFGHGVEVGATLFTQAELVGVLEGEKFTIETALERGPYEHEYQSRRLYIRAARD